jgi:hypothetical protein
MSAYFTFSFCRAAFAHISESDKLLHFNDPTLFAVSSLGIFRPYSMAMLHSFIESGGVTAIMEVLRNSSCPTTLTCTSGLIAGLLADAYITAMAEQDTSWSLENARDLADDFYHAGGWNM